MSTSNLKFDEEFDFVVVGSGGGSMCAALVLRAAEKSVVILEKTALVGGATARSGGIMWIPNNPFMKRDGVPDSYEQAMTYIEATSGQSKDAPGTSREKREAYVVEGPKMIEFLLAQGVKLRRPPYWPDYYDERPGGSAAGRTVSAELFDTNELGGWKDKLRPGFLPLPAPHHESLILESFARSWKGKKAMLKVVLRTIITKLMGKNLVSAGAALQGRMLQAALNANVDIRTKSGVTTFVTENDSVRGVVTTRNGREWRIGARLGVLVNAGGFAQNREMRAKYLPDLSVEWTGVPEGDTGEMLREMMQLGAATAQLDEIVGQQMSIPPGRENHGEGISVLAVGGQMDIAKPHSILVDQSGVRYMNEGGSYMEFCQLMQKRHHDVPAIPSWQIVDAQYIRKYMLCGTMPGTKKPAEWYASGFLKRADTMEDLARHLNIDPPTLKATVDRFNADARTGRDTQFDRGDRAYDKWLGDFMHTPSQALGPIEQGPFYAVPVVPGDLGTYGGVVTDVHARVLRENGSIIPGLYATGVSTASMMGRYYPGAGASVGPSFVGGFIAAKHATNAANSIG